MIPFEARTAEGDSIAASGFQLKGTLIKMQYYDCPDVSSEFILPLFVFNVGVNRWQYHVVRGDEFILPQFIYSTEGGGTLIFDGETHIIEPETAFFLPEHYPHEYYSNGGVWDTHWVVLAGFAVKETLRNMGFDKPLVFKLSDIKLIEHYFKKMHEAIIGDKNYGTFRAAGFLYDFLLELYRQLAVFGAENSVSPFVIKAIDYINVNYASNITMEQLCKISGVGSHYLCRLFRTSLDTRPMEYVAKRRIRAAKEMLLKTNKSLAQIAEETGFCESSYLCRLFKRYVGMTPTQFRKG